MGLGAATLSAGRSEVSFRKLLSVLCTPDRMHPGVAEVIVKARLTAYFCAHNAMFALPFGPLLVVGDHSGALKS